MLVASYRKEILCAFDGVLM